MTKDTFNDDTNKHFENKVNSAYDRSSVENDLHSSAPPVSGKTSINKRTLKLTEYRKTWVHKWVRIYANQIGIREQDRPSVVFTSNGVLALPKHLTEGRRTVSHKYLGICFCKAKTILINVKKHRSFKDLKHTITESPR
jgi:hypothetical protein